MSDWEWKEHRSEVLCIRMGWLGLWDALVSIWTGKRLQVIEPVTVSLWVKNSERPAVVELKVAGDVP